MLAGELPDPAVYFAMFHEFSLLCTGLLDAAPRTLSGIHAGRCIAGLRHVLPQLH